MNRKHAELIAMAKFGMAGKELMVSFKSEKFTVDAAHEIIEEAMLKNIVINSLRFQQVTSNDSTIVHAKLEELKIKIEAFMNDHLTKVAGIRNSPFRSLFDDLYKDC